MMSLKHFLHASEEDAALRKVIYLLLEKTGSCAVESDRSECAMFGAEMGRLRIRASSDESPEALYSTAGVAVNAMEAYNRQITIFLGKQGMRLRNIVSMVTETVIQIGGENEASAQRLREIGNRFERAGTMDDLQALKAGLAECIQSLRTETERQKAGSETVTRFLNQEIERAHTLADPRMPEMPDPVTGLPCGAAGIRAMQEAATTGKRVYAVAMVVNRIQSINARYGYEVGDRILRAFMRSAGTRLMPADRMFRGNGPVIVALLERAEEIEKVRAQVRRILDVHLEENFEVDGRLVLIPVSAVWSVFPLQPPVIDVIRQIQAFVFGQSPPNHEAASVSQSFDGPHREIGPSGMKGTDFAP